MWRFFKIVLTGVSAAFVLLVAVLLINTVRYTPPAQASVVKQLPIAPLEMAAVKLSQAVAFQTVSSRVDSESFDDFLSWLPTAFPGVHRVMSRRLLNERTPLYVWTGSDSSLKSVLFGAHYDVVPVQQETLGQWTHQPFTGAITKDYVWGRGALDNKGSLVALLEAAERLVASGFAPKRTLYFSLGHDEELGGENGAGAVAALLEQEGVELAWVLDEGSFVLDGIIKGLERPVASINVAEKGFMSLKLVVSAAGGHSSMPPKETAVGTLAVAIDRLQKAPVPGGLTGVSEDFFDQLGRHFGFGRRVLFANRWLFSPLLETFLSSAATTNAVIRTTTAPTMLTGSPAHNVLPTQATATINFRLHPRDTVESVVAYVRRTVADERVEVRMPTSDLNEASSVSSHSADGYTAIAHGVHAVYGDVITVPGLTIAATDSRHYSQIAQDAYRFSPFVINDSDLSRFHGIDERLSLNNLQSGITFYMALMRGQ